MPINFLTAFNRISNDSLIIEFNDTVLNTTDLIMSISSTSPFLSSSLNNNYTAPVSGPDQIYLDILANTRFYVQRIIGPLVILIGVIGNSMTIVIMTRKRMRSSTNVYLAFLATVDMLYLSFTFILSLKHYPGIMKASPITRIYWSLLPVLMMTADLCTNTSVWLTAAFTVERFIVVSNPIRGKVICTESRARKLCIFIVLVCTAFVIPTPFEWKIIEKVNKDQIQTFVMEPSDLGRNQTYKSIYYWLTSVLFIFIPLILLIVFNSFLIRSVQKSVKERQKMTNTQTKSKSEIKKEKKIESKQSKNKQQEFKCKLQLDANNNDNPTSSNNSALNIQSTSNQPLSISSSSNLQNNQSTNNDNLKPNKNLLQTQQQQRRISDNPSLDSRTSASSPTATAPKNQANTSNRTEQSSAKQETKIKNGNNFRKIRTFWSFSIQHYIST